jgi:hypothetical protein
LQAVAVEVVETTTQAMAAAVVLVDTGVLSSAKHLVVAQQQNQL